MLRDLVRHRDLLWLLTVREIRIRYARALLGAGWVVFLPLAMVLVFTAMNFQALIPEGSRFRETPYPAFALTGLVGWMHFLGSVTQATPSLPAARDVIRKSAFPREVIPLSKMLACLLDLFVGGALVAALLLWYGIPLAPAALGLPAILFLQILFTTGVILALSAGNMMFRDVNFLVQAVMPLAMFATSVVYEVRSSPDANPVVAFLLRWNPMSAFLNGYREVLLRGTWPGAALLPGAVAAVVAFAAGALLFRRLSPRFAEEL